VRPLGGGYGSGRKQGGFTLLELLVVVGLIAMLVGMLLPSLRRARALAVRATCASNLHAINMAMGQYLAGNNGLYPAIARDPWPGTNLWLWMGRGWRTMLAREMNMTVETDRPSLLYCKADASAGKYEYTSYSYSMCFYHSPAQIDTLSSAAQCYGTGALDSIAQKPDNLRRAEAKVLIGEWLSNHEKIANDSGWWCKAGKRLFLLADGHVEYLSADQILPGNDLLPDANLTVHGIEGVDIGH
jgi:prepilin-type N-terminal cleavage/methylation domain-containing protein